MEGDRWSSCHRGRRGRWRRRHLRSGIDFRPVVQVHLLDAGVGGSGQPILLSHRSNRHPRLAFGEPKKLEPKGFRV